MYFFFNDTATTEIYTLSLHDALPISEVKFFLCSGTEKNHASKAERLEAAKKKVVVSHHEIGRHTSELQSPVPISYAVFCLKKKKSNFASLNTEFSRYFSGIYSYCSSYRPYS